MYKVLRLNTGAIISYIFPPFVVLNSYISKMLYFSYNFFFLDIMLHANKHYFISDIDVCSSYMRCRLLIFILGK